MKEKLLLLIKLQECDSQLVKLSAKKKKLPENIDKLDKEFSSFREGIEKNKIKYDELKSLHTERENKIKKLNEGMVKTKARLLEVKNNKEYQAMLKEIEIAESSRGDIETEIISILEALDTIDADVVDWEKKRINLQKNVSDDLLARYEKIRNRNKGVGVISVWKAVCNGCHMNIPPQLYNELQKSNELLSCPNCSRIIYFQDMEKPA